MNFHDFYYAGMETRETGDTIGKDIIGSSNVLFLNDLNRTFIGTSMTQGVNRNPTTPSGTHAVEEGDFAQQGQRWHFTMGLPSSSVFVEAGEPCTTDNILALQTDNRVIIGTLDIRAKGTVWTLQYEGNTFNNGRFQIFEGGKIFDPPAFDDTGEPVAVVSVGDPSVDVTSGDPIIGVYPPDKTSADDLAIQGTH